MASPIKPRQVKARADAAINYTPVSDALDAHLQAIDTELGIVGALGHVLRVATSGGEYTTIKNDAQWHQPPVRQQRQLVPDCCGLQGLRHRRRSDKLRAPALVQQHPGDGRAGPGGDVGRGRGLRRHPDHAYGVGAGRAAR